MTIDAATRREIASVIRQAIAEQLAVNNEEWLSEEDMLGTFPMFSPTWVKRYGSVLPRTRATVVCKDGTQHASRYMYGKHAIQRMIAQGELLSINI